MKRLGVDHFLSQGTDMMLYAVVDPIVDGYFPVLDRLGEDLDQLEDEVVQTPNKEVVERLFRVRRELLEVRHTVTPEREVFNQLTNREVGLIATDRLIYFRDVYDHLIRMTDELDTFRELAAGAIETYLSTVNNNLSEIMKRLTAITAILAGIGAVGRHLRNERSGFCVPWSSRVPASGSSPASASCSHLGRSPTSGESTICDDTAGRVHGVL